MGEVPVPFADTEVDTSEPSQAVTTVVFLIAGFAIFSMVSGIGGYVATRTNEMLGSVLGFNPATGESEDENNVPGV